MIPIVVSARGWRLYPQAAGRLISRSIEAKGQYTLVLDESAIAREAAASAVESDWRAHHIDFAGWLKSGFQEDGILDTHAIRNCAEGLSCELPVLLDVRGRRDELVAGALEHVRYAWFPLDEWHPAFVMICDDVSLIPSANALAATFYCQPKVQTDREVAKIAKEIQRAATTLRWLGPGAGRWQRSFFRSMRIFMRQADKREQKRERRGP